MENRWFLEGVGFWVAVEGFEEGDNGVPVDAVAVVEPLQRLHVARKPHPRRGSFKPDDVHLYVRTYVCSGSVSHHRSLASEYAYRERRQRRAH